MDHDLSRILMSLSGKNNFFVAHMLFYVCSHTNAFELE